MENERSDLMVFIDLGFILLVGFLILSDTSPTEAVLLPRKTHEQEDRTLLEERVIYEVHFNANMDFLVLTLPEQVQICAPSGIEEAASCMLTLTDQTAQPVFMLSPYGEAIVQQLVSLLDLCQLYGWNCTIKN